MVKFGKKFFFNATYTKKTKRRFIIGAILLIILIIILIIVISSHKRKKPKPSAVVNSDITIREEISSEVNTPFPDKASYLEKLSNIDINNIVIEYPEDMPKGLNATNCTDEEKASLNNILDNTVEGNVQDYTCAYYVPSEIGSYAVKIKINDKEYDSILKVQDTTYPELVVKNLEIAEGTEYKIEDFVENCIDNYDDSCILNYYYSTYEDSTTLDYSAYKEVGKFNIQISASDKAGNMSKPENVELTITPKTPNKYLVNFDTNGGSTINGEYVEEGKTIAKPSNPTKNEYTFVRWTLNGEEFDFNTPITQDIMLVAEWKAKEVVNPTPKPTPTPTPTPNPKKDSCTNGDLQYDTSKYILAVYADSSSKCATSTSKFNTLRDSPLTANIASKDAARLMKEADVSEYEYGYETRGILNKSGKGLVGYEIEVTIHKPNCQSSKDVCELARYRINSKGKRTFKTNLLNLPK